MSTKARRIQTLDITLPAEMGALARIYSGFHEAGVNVTASWGYEMSPSQAQAHFYVQDVEKARKTLTTMGMKPKLNDAVWFEGDNKSGAYAEMLNKVAKAGVNISATDAFAIGDRFASVLFVAEAKDFAPLCKALNI
ncbi:MAG: hypothetical protein KDD38_01030 [Bdellovibrionales bacterium]|nr:hypothetical protein [Bdellovibrionales bacterium]